MTVPLLADETEQTSEATTTPAKGATADQHPEPAKQQPADKPTPTDPVKTTAGDPPAAEPPTTDAPAAKAPENYEFAVPEGMPEGYELDSQVTDEFAIVSRELDLDQKQAQSLVNKVLPVMHRRAAEQEIALNEQWISQTKADVELGGNKLTETKRVAKLAMKAYGSDGLQELLNSPIGSHPEVVRFLVRVGKTVSEDQFVGGRNVVGAVDLDDDVAVARALYPNSP